MVKRAYPLLFVCARILQCRYFQFEEVLHGRGNYEKLLIELENLCCPRTLKTSYKDRNGLYIHFNYGGLTLDGPTSIPAFGHLSRIYNISVCAFYYIRHRIRIIYPYFPCVIEKCPGGELRHYPIELVEIELDQQQFDSLPLPCWYSSTAREALHLFDSLSLQDSSNASTSQQQQEEVEGEEEDGGGRNQCSQNDAVRFIN